MQIAFILCFSVIIKVLSEIHFEVSLFSSCSLILLLPNIASFLSLHKNYLDMVLVFPDMAF